jgi:hypothetical protein
MTISTMLSWTESSLADPADIALHHSSSSHPCVPERLGHVAGRAVNLDEPDRQSRDAKETRPRRWKRALAWNYRQVFIANVER